MEPSPLFTELIEHFSDFELVARQRLAQLYGATSHMASDLATQFLKHPEVVVNVWNSGDLTADAWSAMKEIAFDHGLSVDMGWSSRSTQSMLKRFGIVSPANRPGTGSLPAIIAAILAPELRGICTTFVTLSGQLSDDEITSIAKAYDIEGNRIECIIGVAEKLTEPATVTDLIGKLEEPDFLGLALMILELGGLCFWHEVMGHDLDRNPSFGENVVALMPKNQRTYEKRMANSLRDYGLVFRIEDDRGTPLAIVPEEAWNSLWALGQDWLTDWTFNVFDALRSQGFQKRAPSTQTDLQAVLKWLVCEVETRPLNSLIGLDPTDEERLTTASGMKTADLATIFTVANELNAVRVESAKLRANTSFFSTLDLPRAAFAREMYGEWCMGFVGSADSCLAEVWGVDESWRRSALRAVRRNAHFAPAWLQHPGVETESTGSGYLRADVVVPEPHLIAEFECINTAVWTAKLTWLDLLSLLDPEHWYPIRFLSELLQLWSAMCVFDQLFHVLQDPQAQIYMPIYRASYLGDTSLTDGFEQWTTLVLEQYFEHIGMQMSDDRTSVRFDPKSLRINSPAGILPEQREDRLRRIFRDPELSFTPPSVRPSFQVVPESTEASMSVDAPIKTILSWLGGRTVDQFDGRKITAKN